MALKITRDLTQNEFPWLDGDIKKGSIVYKYYGYTYGCIRSGGVAVTNKPDKTPFFEVPCDAVETIN